jgi:hypothetical protein
MQTSARATPTGMRLEVVSWRYGADCERRFSSGGLARRRRAQQCSERAQLGARRRGDSLYVGGPVGGAGRPTETQPHDAGDGAPELRGECSIIVLGERGREQQARPVARARTARRRKRFDSVSIWSSRGIAGAGVVPAPALSLRYAQRDGECLSGQCVGDRLIYGKRRHR